MNKNAAGLYLLFFFISCSLQNNESKHAYIVPEYDDALLPSSDTIKLPLDSITSGKFLYSNFKELDSIAIFSFYDKVSSRLNIYDLNKRRLIKQLDISDIATPYRKFASTKTYFRSWDSIYVYSNMNIYRIDSAMNVKDSIALKFNPYRASSYFKNSTPPVFIGEIMYVPAFPSLDKTLKSDVDKWKSMYRIDWIKHQCSLFYPLPPSYKDSLYDKQLMAPSYCYNSRTGNFIYSFAVDSNIYVTSFNKDYYSFAANSLFFNGNTPSYTLDELKDNEKSFRKYIQVNTYGPIYYDGYRDRYLRVAEKGISRMSIKRKNFYKEKSIVILDSKFKIIGEHVIDNNIDLLSLFITKEGIYARVLGIKNEDNVYLVKLQYRSDNSKPTM